MCTQTEHYGDLKVILSGASWAHQRIVIYTVEVVLNVAILFHDPTGGVLEQTCGRGKAKSRDQMASPFPTEIFLLTGIMQKAYFKSTLANEPT